MKKFYNLLIIGIVLLSIQACKSELDLDKKLKFSSLPVEKQKQKIEQNGIDFLTAMEDLMNTKAASSLKNMFTLNGSKIYKAPIKNMIISENEDILKFFDINETIPLNEEMWGEYQYNFQTKKIEKTKELTNKLIVHFPETAKKTANNCVITLSQEESSIKVPNSDIHYPSKISFKMTIDSKEVMSSNFNGTYHSDGVPKKITLSTKLESFKWTAEIENNKKTAKGFYKFQKGSKVLIKALAEVNGELNENDLRHAIEDKTPENTVKNFALYFQVMDIAAKGGTTDFKAFGKEIKKISENNSWGEKEKAQKTAEVLNKYVVCTAYFANDNRKFADLEFFEKENTVSTRFLLSDGSKVSAEEFIRTGFGNLLYQLQDFIRSMR